MTTPSPVRLTRMGRQLSLAGGALGVLGLAGWLIDARAITTVIAGRPAMMPNTALAIAAVGIAAGMTTDGDAAARARTVLAATLRGVVLAMAVLTGWQYVAGSDIGIDRLLLDVDSGGRFPGRPSPVTLAALSLLAAGGLGARSRGAFGAGAIQAFSLSAGFLAFFSLVAHLFGASEFYQLRSSPVTGVAVLTSVALLLLAIGLLLAGPDCSVPRMVASPSPGGGLARRLGLVATVGMPLLGAAAYQGARAAGLDDLPLTLALLTTISVPLALALVFVTARWVDRAQLELIASREHAGLLVEEATRRSEARLDSIIALAADAIITIDDSGTIVMYNQGAARIFGWTRDEVLGRPLEVLLPAHLAGRHGEHVRAFGSESAAARMMSDRQSVAGRRKTGEEFPAEAAISKLQQDGRWLYTVMLRDTTTTVQLEHELRRGVARFRFLSDVGDLLTASLADRAFLSRVAELVVEATAVCCVIEVDTPPSRLIARCASGSHGESLDGKQPVLTVREPMLRHDVTADTWRTLVADPALEYPFGTGTTSLLAVPIAGAGAPLGALLMLSGAERRYDDADLQLASDLARRIGLALDNERLYRDAQAATRTRDEILGIVAHDLRSPLAAVQFGAEALARQIPADQPVATQRALGAIRRSIGHASRLVEDLLHVAQIDAGQLRLTLKETPLAAVLADVSESFAGRASTASVALAVDAPAQSMMLLADEDRLHQALANLVDNAIKFTPAGGGVRVAARQQDGETHIVVSNTGSGIPVEHLPHLFDRFWQARASRRGAGLGLAIVKGIVEAHGGRVWAESAPGRETAFVIALPSPAPSHGDSSAAAANLPAIRDSVV